MADLYGNRPRRVQLLANLERKFRLPTGTLWGVYGTETDFGRNLSTSGPGAQGYFQFMPETAASMGVNPNNFASSAKGAARYLSQYKGRGLAGMLAAYNAGPAGNPNNPETQAYIPKVQGYAKQAPYRQVAGGANPAVAKLAAKQLKSSAVADLPSTPLSTGPKLSEVFSTLANLDNNYVNPYTPRGGMSNWELFRNIAEINEDTQASIDKSTASLAKLNQQLGKRHIRDVDPTDPAQTGVTTRGAQAALQFADNRLRKGIHETGTNSGPYISDWIQSMGLTPGASSPWCGVFVGKGLQAAGVNVDRSVVSVAEIRRMAQEGRGGFERLVSFNELRPGDVFMRGDDHTGFVRSINRKTGMITTVEGNSSDAVSSNQLASSGLDFARPAYGKGRKRR